MSSSVYSAFTYSSQKEEKSQREAATQKRRPQVVFSTPNSMTCEVAAILGIVFTVSLLIPLIFWIVDGERIALYVLAGVFVGLLLLAAVFLPIQHHVRDDASITISTLLWNIPFRHIVSVHAEDFMFKKSRIAPRYKFATDTHRLVLVKRNNMMGVTVSPKDMERYVNALETQLAKVQSENAEMA